jgi:glycosyltransferase involved in cell wall biosynthesis
MTATDTYRLRGEIESPRPLRFRADQLALHGWCLVEGAAEPPPIRCVTEPGTLDRITRHERTDVPALLPGEPAADHCGFTITGWLSAGVHLAHFEARLPNGEWRRLKSLSLVVEAPPLAAEIESPAGGNTMDCRVHVEGWALDRFQRIQELWLRYGHQELPCDVGRSRADLPSLYPDCPHASHAGFKSRVILSAGLGPLRLKARLADGSAAIAHTSRYIDIRTDENIDRRIDLGASRVFLPFDRITSAPCVVAQAERPLNILFILPGSFASNSALHVAGLANELSAAGHACTVAVTHDLSTLDHHQAPAFRGLLHTQAESGVRFADGRGPDIIHAWTTRENVRRLTETLRVRHGARVVVHLEDHEQEILALSLGRSLEELETLTEPELDRLVPSDLSHPRRGREFLARASAVTVISERLRETVPSALPCHTIRPAADARYFRPQPRRDEFRNLINRTPGETVLFYHGNVHAANAAEVRELYAAVGRLNQEGTSTTLIRTGRDSLDFLGPLASEVAAHVISLGQINHHHHLPALMALADIFVQPGQSDAFNDYRFPSKLPEFFAIGRPVVLPRTNLGTQLRHRIDAYVLERADADGITTAVLELRRDRALYDRLCEGALSYASEHFSWQRSAQDLAKFYQATLRP